MYKVGVPEAGEYEVSPMPTLEKHMLHRFLNPLEAIMRIR
jgi:hypothetical protein